MRAIHKQRLLKLAKHLKRGKLGHEKFDFRKVNCDDLGNELDTNGCGTAGCAIGECPIVFPKTWEFRNGQPAIIERRRARHSLTWDNAKGFAMEFFALDHNEASHLFAPGCQMSVLGGVYLSGNATAKQVAANIEAFVKVKSNKPT